MKAWQWYETDKQLPKITNGDGTSDYILAFPGSFLPQVVKYSNGSSTKRGWWTTDLRFLSMRVGGRCSTQQRFPFWSHIEQPTFENLLEQTHTWSEEDEKIYNRIYDIVHSAAFSNCEVNEDGEECGEYAKITKWFKSLKDRYTWKPSDELMAALERCVDYLDESDNEDSGVIGSLCHDLKLLYKD